MTASRIEADRISVVLFDLGGVVFTFDWQRAFDHWARAAGGDAADLADRFSHGDAYQRFERGELSPSEYFSLLRAELAVDLGDEDLAEGWNAIFGDLVPGITETIAAVRESPLRIAALSNTNATHTTMFSRWFGPLLADLGRIFASHELGHRKPEPTAFLTTTERLGVEPEEVLFFDDLAANVEGARRVGMQAAQVTGIDDVRRALAQLGIDPSA